MILFTPAVEFVLKHEGGYVDDPVDPGGATMSGITQRTLNDFNKTYPINHLPINVKDLTYEQVKLIYMLMYWNKYKFNEIDQIIDSKYQPIVNKVFDICVNMGPLHAENILQYSSNIFSTTTIPGIFKLIDQSSILGNAIPPNQTDTCLMRNIKFACVKFRLDRVAENPSQVKFLHGWLVRDLDG